jgi:hypothetical protein
MKTILAALLLASLASVHAQSPFFVTPAVRAPHVAFHTFVS